MLNIQRGIQEKQGVQFFAANCKQSVNPVGRRTHQCKLDNEVCVFVVMSMTFCDNFKTFTLSCFGQGMGMGTVTKEVHLSIYVLINFACEILLILSNRLLYILYIGRPKK